MPMAKMIFFLLIRTEIASAKCSDCIQSNRSNIVKLNTRNTHTMFMYHQSLLNAIQRVNFRLGCYRSFDGDCLMYFVHWLN